jgi:hypothetical protein
MATLSHILAQLFYKTTSHKLYDTTQQHIPGYHPVKCRLCPKETVWANQ